MITDALCDALEAHRAAVQGRGTREPTAAGGTTARPGQGGREQASEPRQCRLLTFAPAAARGSPSAPAASPAAARGETELLVAPLESDSPTGALHEALARLGARAGGTVTLVVMEPCCLGTLARAVREGMFAGDSLQWSQRLTRRALVRTCLEVARALAHMHAEGVVHGDLRPGNILLQASRADRRGFTVKVRCTGPCHPRSQGGSSLDMCNKRSTPLYMAPETLLGHLGKPADVWGFGVILSHLLTRREPYGGMAAADPGAVAAGITDGTLQLQWPELPSRPEASSAAADDAQRSCGHQPHTNEGGFSDAFCTPDSALGRSLGLMPGAAADQCNTLGPGASCPTNGNPASCAPQQPAANVAPSTATLHEVYSRTCDSSSVYASRRHVTAAVGGWDDPDPALASLVSLGRRCTARDPAARPRFAEVIEELLGMEAALKAARSSNAARATFTQQSTAGPSAPPFSPGGAAKGTASEAAAGPASTAQQPAVARGVGNLLDACDVARMQLDALMLGEEPHSRLSARACPAAAAPPDWQLPPDDLLLREPAPLPPHITELMERARAAGQHWSHNVGSGRASGDSGVRAGAGVPVVDAQKRREHAAAVEALRLAITEQLSAVLEPALRTKQQP
ncbi:hypothetical protein HYH03_014535 [Edaphochlamys debaryana]|uniref:Protein kinase domain-containing protein n=1 Tax=Edaphochlamys debaryana TaxID=47281 RepID=A0A836BS74_9CHLO|nr:hypothetical protein HYH03_014535 [Edaphochlamys debaryana]|eukprot:KAG2486852.1 hypothetical protein HYH03_014535 [Edaphochlamys debaryana]